MAVGRVLQEEWGMVKVERGVAREKAIYCPEMGERTVAWGRKKDGVAETWGKRAGEIGQRKVKGDRVGGKKRETTHVVRGGRESKRQK